ncbi:MAG: FliI/YscN family ATPase [Myxococcales bacterium]|nr:FliI/YscN family ATPase [Myxococcales bacterium]MCB9648654.1 FliI/YscN family ATPase [Deltaproteobacteria bacterium]
MATDLVRRAQSVLASLPMVTELGRVDRLTGFVVEGRVRGVRIGSVVQIERERDWVAGEVVGFRDDRVLIVPESHTRGIAAGAFIRPASRAPTVPVSDAVLGRIIDAFGQPLDGGPPIPSEGEAAVHAEPPAVHRRAPVSEALETGVRVIDGVLTCGRGQRVGLFAGAGVGKTMLIRQIASQAQADVVVMGLIGERGIEVRDLLEHPPHENTVMVVATSDRPPMERVRGALVATAIAERFRDQGQHVLLVVDSLTRYAMALREIGLAAQEPPATKGYPPSVFAKLPQLLERVGPLVRGGSITGFYTVLVEGDDLSDPVADSARSLLDGHIVLSRDMASRGHFPAVDVLASASRVALKVMTKEHRVAAAQARQALETVDEVQNLRALGAYTPGKQPELDWRLHQGQALVEWSRQGPEERATLSESVEGLARALMSAGRRPS